MVIKNLLPCIYTIGVPYRSIDSKLHVDLCASFCCNDLKYGETSEHRVPCTLSEVVFVEIWSLSKGVFDLV